MKSLCNRFTVKVGVIAIRSFLNGRARGQSLKEFMNRFSKHDYVDNGNKQLLKKLYADYLFVSVTEKAINVVQKHFYVVFFYTKRSPFLHVIMIL